MRKIEVIAHIANKTGIAREDVQLVIEELWESVMQALSEGEAVHFRGFGSFIIKKRKARIARNISRNIAVELKKTCLPSFKPSDLFVDKIKDAMNELC